MTTPGCERKPPSNKFRSCRAPTIQRNDLHGDVLMQVHFTALLKLVGILLVTIQAQAGGVEDEGGKTTCYEREAEHGEPQCNVM